MTKLTRLISQFPLNTCSAYLWLIVLFNFSIVHGQQRTYQGLLFKGPATVQEKVQTVEPGRTIERTLEGGQRHEYLVAISPGSYLKLTVNQLGIDVLLTIYRSDGERVVEVDKANGTRGREMLSLILDATSKYHVQIRAREARAIAGRYTLEITEAHPPISQDESRWGAEQKFDSAKQLLRQDPTAVSKAIEKYRESLELWRTANDPEGESITLLSIANAHFTEGKMQQALERYQDAQQIFQSINDALNKALTQLYIGSCRLAMGDSEKALTQYEQALQSFTELDDQKYRAFALNEIGRVYYLQGNGPQARDYYLRAAEIRKLVDDRKGLAFSLNTVGRVLFYHFGEDEQALTYYKQALELQQEIKDFRRAAQTLDDIGRIHFSFGRHQEALGQYNKALELQRQSGDIIGEAETSSYIGMVYTASGRHEEALEYYQRALKIQQDKDVKDRVGEARTLHNMGMAHFSSGSYEKALIHLNSALKIWLEVLHRTAEADTRYAIARVELRRGNLNEARKQLELALPIVESLRSKIANQYLRTSYFASVQNYYELYIEALMQMHKKSPADGLDKLALSINERARSRALLDTLVEAPGEITRGVDPGLLKQQRALQKELTTLSQRRMLRNPDNKEEEAAARTRLASLLMNYQRVEEQILQRNPAYAALTQPSALRHEDIQKELLDPGTALLSYVLGDERSYLWVVTRTSTSSYELPKRTDIENAARQLRAMLTARNKIVASERAVQSRARVERADTEGWRTAAKLSEMLALGKASANAETKRLVIVSDGELQNIPFAMLPIPQKTELKGPGTWVPRLAPISGLAPLVVYYEVAMLPSISVLAELRRRQPGLLKAEPQKIVIVLADPVFDENDERVTQAGVLNRAQKSKPKGSNSALSSQFPPASSDSSVLTVATRTANIKDSSGQIARLPFTRREANEIVALLPPPNGTKVLDFKASRATISGELLSQYRIVHFATHGLTNDEYPELSGLLLSLVDEEGQPQDGFLQLHEVYNLNLPVELVVLSACETALGRKVRGEGLIGLTRGFMYAGAKRVVASLWQVNDASTSKLMKYFYQAMLKDGMPPAAALRAAQLEMLKQPQRQSPYYWAAFMLHGDWRE
jgi:CHAT domain-containing protein/predicted negative regulator of RcsB-dependent stress response